MFARAYRRLLYDVLPLGVDGLVTTCPTCYINFRFTSMRKKFPIRVYALAEIVDLGFRL